MTTYDIYTVSQLLIPTIGFRQTVAKKEYLNLDPSLIADSLLGQLPVNSLSELFLSVESMSETLVFDEGYDVDAYVAATSYKIGDRVSKVTNDRKYVWVSKTDPNLGNDPEADDGTNWKTALSDRLDKYRESAALETVSGIIANQINSGFSSGLSVNNTVYKETSTAQPAQLKGQFVGMCIKPFDYGLNRVLTIDKLGMKITGAQADLKLYLYHSSRKAPIQTFTIPSADQELDTHKWYQLEDDTAEKLPIIIDLFSPDYNQGGVFYLGFYEDDFAGNAQGYGYNEAAWPYGTLGMLYRDQHFAFSSIEIPSVNLNGTDLPNIGQYYDGANYNSQITFNLEFTKEQSFYPKFTKNILLLQKVYQYTLAFMILKDMLHNDRISKAADNAENKIHELLYGSQDNEQDKGLAFMKMVHVKKLTADMNKLFDDFQGAYQGAI